MRRRDVPNIFNDRALPLHDFYIPDQTSAVWRADTFRIFSLCQQYVDDCRRPFGGFDQIDLEAFELCTPIPKQEPEEFDER